MSSVLTEQPAVGSRRDVVVNDFSLQVATANGSGSQTAEQRPDAGRVQMGVPVSGKDLFPHPVSDLGPIADLQLSEGYAIASSSYSQRSWALFTAPDDNAEMLAAFRRRSARPGAIIPWGGSLGGLIALKLAEDPRFAPVPAFTRLHPAAGSRVWDAGFDLRLAYDVVCAGAGDLPKGDPPYPWAYNLSDIPDNLSDLEDEARLLQTLIPLNQCTGINLPKEFATTRCSGA
jgi:hypothetical protein